MKKRTLFALMMVFTTSSCLYRTYHLWMRSTDAPTRETQKQQALNSLEHLKSCDDRYVCDMFQLFSPQQHDYITSYHRSLLELFDIDLRVFVSMHEQATSLFNEIKAGEHSKTRKGMLLLINPKKNLVRLEVSAGLDAVYTDGFVKYLQERQMLPFFHANRVADGIVATTEMIVDRAKKAQKGEEFVPPEQLTNTLGIGAGAQSQANIGTGYTPPQQTHSQPTTAAHQYVNPLDVVQAYHEALARGDASPDLPFYSASTKDMRKSWVVTPAQMKNELNAYASCSKGEARQTQGLAIVRYALKERECAPYFLVWEDNSWKLDFAAMMQRIQFNVSNEWHRKQDVISDYDVLFSDWNFDENGFPVGLLKLRWGLSFKTYPDGITRITYVSPNSPAQAMNFAQGDEILQWGKQKTPSYVSLWNDLGDVKAGESIPIVIRRAGETYHITLTAPPVP
jgi:uncharacterized protein